MKFSESVSTCLKKYFVFEGRASRSEYWWFQLIVTPSYLIAEILKNEISYLFYGILIFAFMYYWFQEYRSSFNNERRLICLFTLSLFSMLYLLTLPLFPAWFGLGYYLITKMPAGEGEK